MSQMYIDRGVRPVMGTMRQECLGSHLPSVPGGDHLPQLSPGQANPPSYNGQRHYPHNARGTTAPTCPAISSPEASRTPAARACGTVRAEGVREPVTERTFQRGRVPTRPK